MRNLVQFVVGILGNCSSLSMYAVPAITFRRVLRKKSTEDFSGVPYVIAFFNCMLYTMYGTPIISVGSENMLVSTVNGVGLLLEGSFIVIFLLFSPPQAKRNAGRMVAAVVLVLGIIFGVSVFGFQSHKMRKMVVGISAIVSSVLMYGSPLSAMRVVIKTKSVEFMPFNLSLFSFSSSALWLTYGALGQDIYIMAPNILGLPLCFGQLVLYFIYRNKGRQSAKNEMSDLEKGIKQNVDLQLVTAATQDIRDGGQ